MNNSVDIKVPSITAPTDAGKIEQIRRYLYQLADQLNWALNLPNDDKALEKEQEHKANKIYIQADTVIEIGKKSISTNGYIVNWHYKKWQNGNLECWCKRNITINTTCLLGTSNLYFDTVDSISYPFEFIEKPITQISCENENEVIPLFVVNCGSGTTTYANPIMLCASDSKTNINCNVLYTVYGKWK